MLTTEIDEVTYETAAFPKLMKLTSTGDVYKFAAPTHATKVAGDGAGPETTNHTNGFVDFNGSVTITQTLVVA